MAKAIDLNSRTAFCNAASFAGRQLGTVFITVGGAYPVDCVAKSHLFAIFIAVVPQIVSTSAIPYKFELYVGPPKI